MKTNTQMSVEDFGRLLITTGDLDPIYIALRGTFRHGDDQKLARWLVAYWCFYHAGFACFASEQTDFWRTLKTAAENTDTDPAPTGGRWPRGSERRHFRGQQGIKAIDELAARWPTNAGPHRMVQYIAGCRGPDLTEPVDCAGIIARTKEHRGFGDWISFKVADMMETNIGVPVRFDNGTIFMFDTPVKGALIAAQRWAEGHNELWEGEKEWWEGKLEAGQTTNSREAVASLCDSVVDKLTSIFADLKAAPRYNRPIQLQEVETVLCKWKSYLGGHYPPGKDSHEIAQGIAEWAPYSSTAAEFARTLPVFRLPVEAV